MCVVLVLLTDRPMKDLHKGMQIILILNLIYNIYLVYYRYKMVCKETWPRGMGTAKDTVAQILKSHNIAASEYRFGKTKIFIRNPTTVCSQFISLNTFLYFMFSHLCYSTSLF